MSDTEKLLEGLGNLLGPALNNIATGIADLKKSQDSMIEYVKAIPNAIPESERQEFTVTEQIPEMQVWIVKIQGNKGSFYFSSKEKAEGFLASIGSQPTAYVKKTSDVIQEGPGAGSVLEYNGIIPGNSTVDLVRHSTPEAKRLISETQKLLHPNS